MLSQYQYNSQKNTWLWSLLIALALHIVLIGLIILNPRLELQDRRQRQSVRLIRLAGGGNNTPGFVRTSSAPADQSPVSDGRPRPQPQRPREQPREEQRTQPQPPAEQPQTRPEPAEETVTQPPATEETTPSEPSTESTAESTSESQPAAAEEETGEGVGTRPGPEGPGLGIRSDANFPGAEAYLSRVEAEVQRRFNFPGRGSGVYAEYHFYIERNGRLSDLVLMRSSGISSLDLSARSAIMRARFPQLPSGFVYPRLGVTYRFYDAE